MRKHSPAWLLILLAFPAGAFVQTQFDPWTINNVFHLGYSTEQTFPVLDGGQSWTASLLFGLDAGQVYTPDRALAHWVPLVPRTESGNASIVVSCDAGACGVATTPRRALSTCTSAIEGQQQPDILSGAATGKYTKMCLCVSDGAGAYTWVNIVTGTIGTSTTCGTE